MNPPPPAIPTRNFRQHNEECPQVAIAAARRAKQSLPMADTIAPPPAAPQPQRFDPWSGQRLRGLRFFAVPTVVHAGILILLGTITLRIARKVEAVHPLSPPTPEIELA